MAKKVLMEFKKGDNRTDYFKLPIANYVAGGTLFFAAKPAVDNDSTDAAAVLNKEFTDADVTLTATHATWDLTFVPADFNGISFSTDEDVKDYLGEFQYIDGDGIVSSFPEDNNYIDVKIYADIKRGTT